MPKCHNATVPKYYTSKMQSGKMPECQNVKMPICQNAKTQNDKRRQKYREMRWNVSKLTKIC